MKNLTANKVVAIAACAASTASSVKSNPELSRVATARGTPWVVRKISRGGSTNNADDDGNSKGKNGKRRKSTKSKREEKTRANNSEKSENGKRNESSGTNSNPFLEEIIQQDDFYKILGVTKTATEREIQKAYRKRCVQTHPDKTGGDRRAFDKVAEAYDILSEPSKREIYNRFGKEGLDPTSGVGSAAGFGGGGAADMFRSMFQQAQQQRQQQQRRNQNLRYQLEVTLEDLFHGKTQSVTVTPPFTRHHSYHQQRQRRKDVEVHIEKGSVSGQSIVMSGEVDFNDDNSPPGDLVFILTQAPHATFTRKGHDLAMELKISLEEALCGLRRSIHHLDGTEIWIESAMKQSLNPNHKEKKIESDENEDDDDDTQTTIPIMIQTGDVQVLKGRGMPKRNRDGEFGDLYIQYRVEMPQTSKKHGGSENTLTKEEYIELARLLSKLDGTNVGNSNKEGKNRGKSGKNPQSRNVGDASVDKQGQLPPPKVYPLQQAKSSDFGVASGRVEWDQEEGPGGFHEDLGDDYHPFASSFFGGQSFGGGRTYSQQFHFGGAGNPFGGYGGAPGDDDGNVQCQQM